jgi:hypothetical protein
MFARYYSIDPFPLHARQPALQAGYYRSTVVVIVIAKSIIHLNSSKRITSSPFFRISSLVDL